jgi:epoxyqueuosine reductase QueG
MSRESHPLARWVREQVEGFLARGADNRLHNAEGDRAFAEPLVGFAAGDDPLWRAYKRHVGPFHLTPAEAFAASFPDQPAEASRLTVVSWVLPHIPQTKKDNRRRRTYPAERWARARIYGEEVNNRLRRRLEESLAQRGYRGVAPSTAPYWRRELSPDYGYASVWSERHAAHAAGLGTFGLCDALITPKGKAMRLGSVVTDLLAPPTPRPYEDHRQWCLFFATGKCMKCAERCPVGAITEAGKDKEKCKAHLRQATAPYVEEHYGFKGYGCGLCQTGVPCESRIPLPASRGQG